MTFTSCTAVLLAAGFTTSRPGRSAPAIDVGTIVQRWTAANRADFEAEQRYNYVERIRTDDGTKTYQVTVLLGTPYKRLIAENGQPLSASGTQEQARDLEEAQHHRTNESPDDRARRLADYQRTREHAHRIIEEMPHAFEYTVRSTKPVGARTVYVLDATPSQNYEPPTIEAQVLAGMRGQFWIDTRTFQLVRGWARVLHAVSIEGFLASVQPGTEFEVAQQPVGDGIWLPTHFSIHEKSSILYLFHRQASEDHTYSDYHRSS